MKIKYLILIPLLIILTIINLVYIPKPATTPVYLETNNQSYDYYLVIYQDLTTTGLNQLCNNINNDTKIFKVMLDTTLAINKAYYFNYIKCNQLTEQLLLQINTGLNKRNINDDIINTGIKISSITYYGNT